MSTFELRTYTAIPGRMPDLLARFTDHTVELFAAHGIEDLGYWIDDADENRLVYLLRHTDPPQSWSRFRSDERWVAARDASESNGALTTSITSVYLTPTDFSALR